MARQQMTIPIGPLAADLERVDQALHSYIDDSPSYVRETIAPFFKRRGKRLRPLLTLVCAKICDGSLEQQIKYAAVVELLHTSSLFHDDVIDEATARRGAPSANKVLGNHLAVLIGDYLYVKALELLVPDRKEIRASVTRTVLAMTEGEILQSRHLYKLPADKNVYMQITRKKTAELIALACKLGAMSSRTARAAPLERYGLNLGIAFQLIDDLLDWTGDEQEMGKPAMQDIREGRITLPAILLLEQLPPDQKLHYQNLFSRKHTPEDTPMLMKFRELMKQYAIESRVREIAHTFSEKAFAQLDAYQQDTYVRHLRILPEQLLNRSA